MSADDGEGRLVRGDSKCTQYQFVEHCIGDDEQASWAKTSFHSSDKSDGKKQIN